MSQTWIARPFRRVSVLLIGVDAGVAAGQTWLMGRPDCSGLACSVATLGGRPALCLALCVVALVALVVSGVANALGRVAHGWEALEYAGVAASVVASVGAVVVAAATVLAMAVGLAVLVSCVRVLTRV